jgi:perosamine synthetase
VLPCKDRGEERRGWFVFVVQLPSELDRDATIRALSNLGIQSKPYLPAIHLMAYYREQFGHKEGEFPVCEAVAAQSIALPYFPEMTEAQVEQVCAALRETLGQT